MDLEIIFRGKRNDNGQWVYGDLECTPHGEFSIIVRDSGDKHTVVPSTVGQFTGLCDKGGYKIFEGDIIQDTLDSTAYTVFFKGGGFVIESNPRHFGYGSQNNTNPTEDLSNVQMSGWVNDCFERIGNIHDDAHLLNHHKTNK